MSCGRVGRLAGLPAIARLADHAALTRLHLGGVLARTGLLERITLTPEGFTVEEQKRLARTLLARGHRLLCLSLHSPSLAPGNTPYAPDAAACAALVDRLERVLDLLLDELGAVPTTAEAVLDALDGASASRAAGADGGGRRGSAG